MTNEFTTIESGTNRAGKKFALVREPSGFGVWTLCANYAAHIRGGISYAWRYCTRKQSEAEARAVFARKLKGKAR